MLISEIDLKWSFLALPAQFWDEGPISLKKWAGLFFLLFGSLNSLYNKSQQKYYLFFMMLYPQLCWALCFACSRL